MPVLRVGISMIYSLNSIFEDEVGWRRKSQSRAQELHRLETHRIDHTTAALHEVSFHPLGLPTSSLDTVDKNEEHKQGRVGGHRNAQVDGWCSS